MAPKTAKEPVSKKNAKQHKFSNPVLYVNRELSLLSFQQRVLEEAQDPHNPLLERVKFVSIVGSNLNEFFMVRVAGLAEQVEAGVSESGPDRMSPIAQLIAIRRQVRKLLVDVHKCLSADLIPALAREGIQVCDYGELSERDRAAADRYFQETVFPILTPLAFDPGRPFPHISNLSLNLAVSLRDPKGVEHFARVKVPDSLPQLVVVTPVKKSRKSEIASETMRLVWIEQVIAANLGALFPGMAVLESHPFHVARNADLEIKELEAEDLLETVEQSVRQRRFGDVVRLEVHDQMPRHILGILMQNLEVGEREVYRVRGLLGLNRLMSLHQLERPDLKYKSFVPRFPPEFEQSANDEDVFSIIRRSSILLHHPFDSFEPVVDFIRKAAHDPNVLAIKIVLYRVGPKSPVVSALLEAIEAGKQVAVLMELKARFDEESNIEWAKALEAAGAHVVYGLLGLKSHCKVLLVVRKEDSRIARYVHLATGNYNVVTAHLYTDIGLFTTDEAITADASDLFNYLTGYSFKRDYTKLLVSPITLRERFEGLIEREIAHRQAGRPAQLIFKMNALVDGRLIRLLYRASCAGLKIDLLVRGICCLRPGLPGVSENIRVRSIVGRFLEHSRVYYFKNGGAEEIYVGSADLMPRNLDRRVEVLFPIEDEAMRNRIRTDIIDCYLADNVKARQMLADGSYLRVRPAKNEPEIDSQAMLIPRGPGIAKRAARTASA
jgi:polyphosphate kinase